MPSVLTSLPKVLTCSALVIGTLTVTPEADAGHLNLCQHRWFTRIPPSVTTTVRIHRARALIECVFRKTGQTNQIRTAWRIARAESTFTPWAYNAGSGASGLFQHLAKLWRGRARSIPGWVSRSPFNPLANTIVTARLVAANGWTAWSTY